MVKEIIKTVLMAIGAAFIIAFLAVSIVYGVREKRGVEKNGYYRFKTVETYKDGWEIVDTDTGWSYFMFSGGGGVVPIYDEYGNTYRANGWRDIGS